MHYAPTAIQLSEWISYSLSVLTDVTAKAAITPESNGSWWVKSKQDNALSNMRLHSMNREKSGGRAGRAGRCLKLLLVHFKFRSHPQIHSVMVVRAGARCSCPAGMAPACRAGRRKTIRPPISLLFAYRIGLKEVCCFLEASGPAPLGTRWERWFVSYLTAVHPTTRSWAMCPHHTPTSFRLWEYLFLL